MNNTPYFDNVDDAVDYLANTAVEARYKRASMLVKSSSSGIMETAAKTLDPAMNYVGIPSADRPEIMKHLGWGAAGAGIGSLLGVGSQLFAPEKKRKYLSGALRGGLLGATGGAGASLVHSHLGPLINRDPGEIAADKAHAEAAMKAQRAGTGSPELERLGYEFGTEPGHVAALANRAKYYGPEAAINEHIAQGRKYNWQFRAPAGYDTDALSKLTPVDPKRPGAYRYTGEGNDEVLKDIMRQMINKAPLSATNTAVRTLGQLASPETYVPSSQNAQGGIPKYIEQTFGTGRQSNWSKGIDQHPRYGEALDYLKDKEFTPTELLNAFREGKSGTNALLDLAFAQKRMRGADRGRLEQELPAMTDEVRKMLGDKGIVSSITDKIPSTGNMYGDVIAPIAAADALGTGINLVKSTLGKNPKDIYYAIQNGKLPEAIKSNPTLKAYLEHAAARGPEGIAEIMKNPNAFNDMSRVNTLEANLRMAKTNNPHLSPPPGMPIPEYIKSMEDELNQLRGSRFNPLKSVTAPELAGHYAKTEATLTAAANKAHQDAMKAHYDQLRGGRQAGMPPFNPVAPTPPTTIPSADIAKSLANEISTNPAFFGQDRAAIRDILMQAEAATPGYLEKLLIQAKNNPGMPLKLPGTNINIPADVFKAVGNQGFGRGGFWKGLINPVGGGSLPKFLGGRVPRAVGYGLPLIMAHLLADKGRPAWSTLPEVEAKRGR